jgi:hypothetical protein
VIAPAASPSAAGIPVGLPARTIALIHPREAQLSQAALRFRQLALPLAARLLLQAGLADRGTRI